MSQNSRSGKGFREYDIADQWITDMRLKHILSIPHKNQICEEGYHSNSG